jgi:hypothetical protein
VGCKCQSLVVSEGEKIIYEIKYEITDYYINFSRTNVMKRGNTWAIAAFISAISPNLIVFAYVLSNCIHQLGQRSDADFLFHSPIVLIPLLGSLFFGFFVFPSFWTMLLGIISVVLAIVARRKIEMGGGGLAGAALVIGTIEIAIISLKFVLMY